MPAVAGEPPALTLPALTDGAELVGEFKNSGYREVPQLVLLPNRQLVRLPPLLFTVAKALHEHRDLADADVQEALDRVADAVTAEAGARLTAEQVVYLVDRKLAPLGVTTYSDGTPAPLVKSDPWLALRFKIAVFPESFTWFVGGLFGWLFRPVVTAAMIAAFLVSEGWLLSSRSMSDALSLAIMNPVSILLVMALGVASCAFHEIGHASACRYGGVRPGAMGCGLYLVWPAFYTDITESYRLGRAGRLRADLAGVYFNAIFVVGLTLLYLQTGFEPLLVAVLYVNIEMIQQLLPTLRFDGYYIMSDLVGVPDLFKYIGPILKRALLRRPADARLKELKRRPQILVTLWVLTVIPMLVFQVGLITTQIPGLIAKDWWMIRRLAAEASAGASALDLVTSGLQILLLVLPVAGLALIFYGMGRTLVRWAVRYVRGPAPQPVPDA
ncbi:Zn-dependent proteases [Mycobacterium tuberculosis]|nr:Zn-dependent proteases [Mycobacterium tuberculosis]